MKMLHLSRLSLRLRFTLGIGAMLLPFLLAAAIGQLYLLPRLTGPFEFIAEEVVVGMQPIRHLQILLPQPAMSANDYLINGSLAERERFARMSLEVDKLFEIALVAPLTLEKERALVEQAQQEWQRARRYSNAILNLGDPIGNKQGWREMEQLDAHIDRAVELLEQVHESSHREIREGLAAARAAERQAIFVTLSAFFLALGISLLAGLLLVRPALAAVDELGKAATRLSSGDLSARVELKREDEFGRLATTFNVMAEQVEQHHQVLEELAVHDGLTGLFNNREFHRQLTEELERSRRYHRAFSLLMLDIDHFKEVNDTYGHQAGDEVLRVVARLAQAQVRPVDRVARYGGEEFIIILPETPADGALNMAERIRAAVADAAISIASGETMRVKISIGVATFPEDSDSEEGLVAAVDQAMYDAKQSGRNRVCRYANRGGNG